MTSKLDEALRAVLNGYTYDPGDSDLDDEQTIHVRMTLGDYRRIRYEVANHKQQKFDFDARYCHRCHGVIGDAEYLQEDQGPCHIVCRPGVAEADADGEPEECPHCHSEFRAIEHLEGSTWECYDCGETFEVASK